MITRMFSRAAGWSRLTQLGGLAWCALSLGCTTVAPSPPAAATPPTVTHLVIINQTSYVWHIAIASTAGKETSEATVSPQTTLQVDLAGGDYLIEQTVTSAPAAPGLTRRIPAHLKPGQTYRWRLDTLLSAGDPAATGAKDQP